MSEYIHMWKVNIRSSPLIGHASQISETGTEMHRANESRLTITSARVCQQELPLPKSVYVVCADPAAADLSSSAMFTIHKAPYLFTTACSDGVVRFWSCQECEKDIESEEKFEFIEWKLGSTIDEDNSAQSSNKQLNQPSQVKIDSLPLAISCSYNSRFAVAYKKQLDNKDAHYFVKIFECESTGGSQWKCEDTISFKVFFTK